ncbi:MAG TPA: IclR family transcriptional regulator [Bacillota bacterium]|jgi:IclR family KDG regulon transcriptional repressor|nr:IclR family transcriptional regulator [Bacillota bacterium]HOA35824.1 IclR family transcriptional regulator [Bacillota bacterium]HOL15163.1 IclR family transcriptional regulator [Bacillota bacterium]HPZ11983.1 IclR family transcriptional regulator [Bacillota bacterium]HQE10099.1 IclR family transcriptional regulator [Bacillota bacterium]
MIQSLERGMRTLLYLSERRTAGVTEVAKKLGVNKSTAYRILETLMSFNMVAQDPATAKYKLGPGILQLSDQLVKGLNIISLAKPYMARLVNETGESSHLCMLSNDSAVVIDQIMTDSRLSVNARVGNTEPVYCSSVGKCLVAFCDEVKREAIISKIDFVPFTKKTITDRERLRAELERIVEKGYAVDNGELSDDIICIAAPIYNHLGKVFYSVGISGPKSRIKDKRVEGMAQKVINTANKISAQLGYVPNKETGSDEKIKVFYG